MKDVMKVVGNILFYVFVLAVLFWTASLTVALMTTLLPGDSITPFFALALFDGGAIVWFLVFSAKARGLMQRGISLLMMILDLIGVVIMSIAELFLGGQTLTSIPEGLGTYVVWAVGVWTALNCIAIYAFHTFDQDVMREIELQTEQDKIESEALKQAQATLQANTQQLGQLLAARLEQQAMYNLRLLPDDLIIDGTLQDPKPKPKKPGMMARIKDALSKGDTSTPPNTEHSYPSNVAINGNSVDPTQPPRPE